VLYLQPPIIDNVYFTKVLRLFVTLNAISDLVACVDIVLKGMTLVYFLISAEKIMLVLLENFLILHQFFKRVQLLLFFRLVDRLLHLVNALLS
jgi:hypothetical protein